MKKNRNIKKLIKKRIEINNGKRENVKQQSSTSKKIVKTKVSNPRPISTPSINKPKKIVRIVDPNKKARLIKEEAPSDLNRKQLKTFQRSGVDPIKRKPVHQPVYFKYPPYEKKKDVDFDLAICISSYNRYSKVKRMLEQLYNQKSKYTFKVFFMNDGSKGTIYARLKKLFPEMVYNENKNNGGKEYYWMTVTKLWDNVRPYNTHAFCQLDDDFVLCNNFVDTLMDKFFEKKKEDNGYMAFRFHLSYFEKIGYKLHESQQSIDGGALYDIDFIRRIRYSIPQTTLQGKHDSSRVWVYITDMLRQFGIRVYVFEESLVLHDGNEDSKLNPEIRKVKPIGTHNFKN